MLSPYSLLCAFSLLLSCLLPCARVCASSSGPAHNSHGLHQHNQQVEPVSLMEAAHLVKHSYKQAEYASLLDAMYPTLYSLSDFSLAVCSLVEVDSDGASANRSRTSGPKTPRRANQKRRQPLHAQPIVAPAAVRLQQNEEKFAAFLKNNRLNASSVSKQNFLVNRARVIALNDHLQRKHFRSTGPFAALTAQQFKARILNSKSPKAFVGKYQNAPKTYDLDLSVDPSISLNNLSKSKRFLRKSASSPSAAKSAKTAKSPSAQRATNSAQQKRNKKVIQPTLLEVDNTASAPRASNKTRRAGGKAGAGGGSAQIAGSKGGSGGGSAQIAGSKGGSGGGDAGIAGSKGGDGGGSSGIAGSKGGDGGGNSGIAGSKGGDGSSSDLTGVRGNKAARDGVGHAKFECVAARGTRPDLVQLAVHDFKSNNIPRPSNQQLDSYRLMVQSALDYLDMLVGFCGGVAPDGKTYCKGRTMPGIGSIASHLFDLGAPQELMKRLADYLAVLTRRCGIGFHLVSAAANGQQVTVLNGAPITATALKNYLLSIGATTAAINQAFVLSQNDINLGWDKGGDVEQVNAVCGSCWAHVTTYALETYRFILQEDAGAYDMKPCVADENVEKCLAAREKHDREMAAAKSDSPFSPQQLLNCVHDKNTNGCDGGSPMAAIDYLKSNPVALLDEQPLTPVPGPCKKPTKKLPPSNTIVSWGWKNLAPPCKEPCPKQALAEFAMLKNLLNDGPVMIAYVDASNWANYAGGVFPLELCSSTMEAGNHVVYIAGYTADHGEGYPTWIIQNSWGENWGNRGTITLPFGLNACGLANFVIVANPPPRGK